MTVIDVNEECHGNVCIAATLLDAIDYLLADGWIDDTTEVWDSSSQKLVTIKELFGNDWENIIRSLPLDVFNDVFENSFYLTRLKVYERKR